MSKKFLTNRRQVTSAIICAYPGGRECAASQIGLELKKFDNHAYENNGSRPLTDDQIFQLERTTGTTHFPEYIAAMYGGMYVPVADPDSLDKVELYSMCVKTAAKRGTVDQIIDQALEDGVIVQEEASAILKAEALHMSARHAEVLAVIQLHSKRQTSGTSR